MKKIILALILPIFGLLSIVNAQIPNAGFETWTAGDPDNWVTSNASPYIGVTQSSNAHSGLSAARGEVIAVVSTNLAPFIQGGPGGNGIPISIRYSATQLYYEFAPIGGDRFALNVVFYKAGNPIAVGAVANPTTVSSYAPISVNMNYTTNDTPDVAIIQISINGPNGNDYHLGSVMFVDDVSFSGPTGIDEASTVFSIGKSFPNPCDEFMEIPITMNNAGNVQVKIYDPLGREVKNYEYGYFASGEFSIPVSVGDLEDGCYFYTLTVSNFSSTGKFAVKR